MRMSSPKQQQAEKQQSTSRKHGASKLLRSLRPAAAKRIKRRAQESAPRNDERDASMEDTAVMMDTEPTNSMSMEETCHIPEAPHARTAILTSYDPLQQQQGQPPKSLNASETLSMSLSEETPPSTSKPWFNFALCGKPSDVYDEDINVNSSSSSDDSFPRIPEDPTVQESIECVFAHQLEQDDFLKMNDDSTLTSPASLLQSRVPSRSFSGGSSSSATLKQLKRRYSQNGLVHVGTYDPAVGKVLPPPPAPTPTVEPTMSDTSSTEIPPHVPHKCPCQCGIKTPLVPVDYWPQRPLMLRPSPGSGVKVRGIRYSSSQDYLWKAGDAQDCIQWLKRLHQDWNSPHYPHAQETLPKCCEECMILPINNGNEAAGKALVVDFESLLFRGTILVRVRHAEGTTPEPYDDSKGYFAGMNRRYQIVIRGQFLESIPWTSCVAGVELDRPVGNLPPKWIVNGALKVVSFFAPQLKASTEGHHPYSVSPFGSTPQTLRLDDHTKYDESLEEMHHEPTHDKHTLLGKASKHKASIQRAKWRKRNFDKLHVAESPTPVTLPQKMYTFEFLQHLLNMQEFCIELGSMLGHVYLQEMLDGQPLQIMAKHVESNRNIWKFDVWHESLVNDSKRHDGKTTSMTTTEV